MSSAPSRTRPAPVQPPVPRAEQLDEEDQATRISGESSTRFYARGEPSPPPPEPTADEVGLRMGTACGRYLLLDKLGAGGLGEVYSAYDPQLHRRVAIKLFRRAVMQSLNAPIGSIRERMLREAQAMARLSHPNVVPVYDVGLFEDQIFITMELVEGRTLRQWIAERSRPWNEVRDVFVEAAKGIMAAHRAGLVHRDFKPHNVLIDGERRVKVLDFGLARGWGGSASSAAPSGQSFGADSFDDRPLLDSALTSPEVMLGTPQYMAPEQLRRKEVGPPADQFSFCVALWEALYGSRPFDGANVRALTENIIAQKFVAVPRKTDVPKWLNETLRVGLRPDPRTRHASMERLCWTLTKDRRRRRKSWVAVGLVAVLSGVSASAATWLTRPEPTQAERDVVETLTIEARAAAAKSAFVYPPLDDATGPTAYAKVLELERYDGPLASEAATRSTDLREEFASTLVRLGNEFWERDGGRPFAADYYAMALVFDPDHPVASDRTSVTPGEIAQLREKAESNTFSPAELVAGETLSALATNDSSTRQRKLRALAQKRDGVAESTRARLREVLAEDEIVILDEPAAEAPKRAEASPKAKKAEPTASEAPAASEPTPNAQPTPAADSPAPSKGNAREASAWVRDGRDALAAGKWDEAERAFHRALGENGRHAGALAGLANVAFERGAYEKAVSYAKKAVSAAPSSAGYHLLLGDAYFKVFDYKNAKRSYQKAQELGDGRAAARLDQLSKRLGR